MNNVQREAAFKLAEQVRLAEEKRQAEELTTLELQRIQGLSILELVDELTVLNAKQAAEPSPVTENKQAQITAALKSKAAPLATNLDLRAAFNKLKGDQDKFLLLCRNVAETEFMINPASSFLEGLEWPSESLKKLELRQLVVKMIKAKNVFSKSNVTIPSSVSINGETKVIEILVDTQMIFARGDFTDTYSRSSLYLATAMGSPCVKSAPK